MSIRSARRTSCARPERLAACSRNGGGNVAGSSLTRWCGAADASDLIQNAEIRDRMAPLPGMGVGSTES